MSAAAAPPPDSDGRFREWFRGLSMTESPGVMCCTVADCRIVDSRWNIQTQRYEAKVSPQAFRNGLRIATISQEDDEAAQAATRAWMRRWIARFGNGNEVWIEIPESRLNLIENPTGRAVLCCQSSTASLTVSIVSYHFLLRQTCIPITRLSTSDPCAGAFVPILPCQRRGRLMSASRVLRHSIG